MNLKGWIGAFIYKFKQNKIQAFGLYAHFLMWLKMLSYNSPDIQVIFHIEKKKDIIVVELSIL